MTDTGPEFAAQIARNNATATNEQVHQLAVMALQFREHSEIPADSPAGVTYSKALWRGFNASDTTVSCGLVFPNKPFPTVHIQTTAVAGMISKNSMTLFRVETTILDNKGLFYRKAKYEGGERPVRYMVGDEEPEEHAFYGHPFLEIPKKENRLWGLDIATEIKFSKAPIVHGRQLSVERFSQLKLLLGTVVEIPPTAVINPDDRQN